MAEERDEAMEEDEGQEADLTAVLRAGVCVCRKRGRESETEREREELKMLPVDGRNRKGLSYMRWKKK